VPDTNIVTRIFQGTLADLDEIVHIERQSFPCPWTWEQCRETLSAEHGDAKIARNSAGLLVGYLFYSRVETEVDILSVAVDTEFRRQGIGALLVKAILDDSSVGRVTLEVRAGNYAARALYEKLGFLQDVIRTRYYADGEDAYLYSFLRK